jgi:phosphopantothenoylcysteine synthetase/decarboxylase
MRLLVTAGPTHEPLDPVRYLANRSSGKMGFALAAAAAGRGWRVTLVAGPVALPTPPGVERIDVVTAAEMFAAVAAALPACQAAVMAAAVADFTPRQVAPHKLKKSGAAGLTLELVPTVDILGSLRGPLGFRGPVVGFAAETRELAAHALDKLRRKGCDLLVANDVSVPGIGFASDANAVTIFAADGSPPEILPKAPKSAIAGRIIERLAALAGHGE